MRRRAEEAGAVFVKVAYLDGNAGARPAPQTVYDDFGRPVAVPADLPQPVPEQSGKNDFQGIVDPDPDRRDRGPAGRYLILAKTQTRLGIE